MQHFTYKRELAPVELQDCRKDDEEKSKDLNKQRRVRKDNPYTVFSMKQRHRAPEPLFFLSIEPSLLLLSHPLVLASSMFLQSHPETPHSEVIKSKGCKFIRGVLWTESIIARTISFYIWVLPVHREPR